MSYHLSERRAKAVMMYYADHGETATANYFNISTETVHRYLRAANFSPAGNTKIPRILLLDIETLPMKGYFWSLWPKSINYDGIISDRAVLGWAAKWLFDTKMMSDILRPEESVKRDDGRICKSVWALMEQADIIIAHNGDKYDLPYLNTRFLLNKLAPPSPYLSIDTLKITKKQFYMPTNRLDYLGKLIDRKGKLKTDFDLWRRCDNGDDEALKYMEQYNREDVLLLEDVYVEIRPFIKNHPNVGMITESADESCPNCGSTNLKECGYYHTSVSKFEALRCMNCGAPSRRRQTIFDKEQKKNILSPVAR